MVGRLRGEKGKTGEAGKLEWRVAEAQKLLGRNFGILGLTSPFSSKCPYPTGLSLPPPLRAMPAITPDFFFIGLDKSHERSAW